MISERVGIEQMLSRSTTERPAPDDHNVKGSSVRAPGGAPKRFVQPVANITPDHVLAEVRVLSSRTRRHRFLSCSSMGRFRMDGARPMGPLVLLWEARCGTLTASNSVFAGCIFTLLPAQTL